MRHKNKVYPRDPKLIENIRDKFRESNILEQFGYTLDGDARFYIDTVIASDYAFVIFASDYVIDFIQQNIKPELRNYLMDGTFDSLPGEFYQLLIISIEYRNDVSKLCELYCPFVRSSARLLNFS